MPDGRCAALPDAHGWRFNDATTAGVPSWATGWYLFATESRFAAESIYAGVGYSTAGGVPPAVPSQTVTFSPPSAPVTGPAAPRVKLFRRPTVKRGRIVVGRVRYAKPCRAHVVLFASGSAQDATLTLRRGGLLSVKVRKGLGQVTRVRVSVDDGPPVESSVSGAGPRR